MTPLAAGIEAVRQEAGGLAAVHGAAASLVADGIDAVLDGLTGLCPAGAGRVAVLVGDEARTVTVPPATGDSAVDGSLLVTVDPATLGPRIDTLAPAATIRAALYAGATAALGVHSRQLLTIAVERGRERTQFGQPIAGFQALRHQLADALVAVESIELAADELADGDGQGLLARACAAKLAANRAALEVRRCAHQVCGGWGYLEEAGLGTHTRSVHALVTGIGPSGRLRSVLGGR